MHRSLLLAAAVLLLAGCDRPSASRAADAPDAADPKPPPPTNAQRLSSGPAGPPADGRIHDGLATPRPETGWDRPSDTSSGVDNPPLRSEGIRLRTGDPAPVDPHPFPEKGESP